MPYIHYESIHAEGFKSCKKLDFQLARNPGLYFIAGENKIEPEQGSNGAGKTTPFDALVFVQWDKTIEGAKGSNVKSWPYLKCKTCKVTLYSAIDDEQLEVIRTHSPKSFLINGKEQEQKVYDDKLRVDYDTFLNSIIIGQFHADFLSKKPSERLQIFSDIMHLDYWEKASAKAKFKRDDIENTINFLEGQQTSLKPNIETQIKQLQSLTTQKANYESDREKTLESYYDQLTSSQDIVKNLETQIESLTSVVTSTSQELKQQNTILQALVQECTSLQQQETLLNQERGVAQAKLEAARQSYERWRGVKDQDPCPSCNQPIPLAHLSREKSQIIKLISELNKAVENTNSQIIPIHQKIVDLSTEIDTSNNSAFNLKNNLDNLTDQLNSVKQSRTNALSNVRTIHDKIEICKKQNNPYQELVATTQVSLNENKKKLEDATLQLQQQHRDLEGYEYWIKGFKELRLWIISDALLALEIEANNALSKLGLLEWGLKFSVEKETSSGSISKGLFIFVFSKLNKTGKVPIELYSGGQRQRLKLATTVALIELIKNYRGFKSNIECWDESVNYLSEEGIEDFIEFLSERSKEQNMAIYYIDQRRLQHPLFDKVIKFTLTENGSVCSEQV